jgi:hypothetical protein
MLDTYLLPGSRVHLLSDKPKDWRDERLLPLAPVPSAVVSTHSLGVTQLTAESAHVPCDGEDLTLDSADRVDEDFEHLRIRHHYGPTISRRHLEELPLHRADQILVLSEARQEDESAIEIDSRNLTTIVHIQGITKSREKDVSQAHRKIKKDCKIVVELLDPKSEQVVKDNINLRKHGSYFYSNALETAVFVMAAGDKYMYNVLMQLLTPFTGAGEIAALSTEDLVTGVEQLSFFDLHARVTQLCGGVLLGWRRLADKSNLSLGTSRFYPQLNPANKADLLEWHQNSTDELLIIRPEEVHPDRTLPRALKQAATGSSTTLHASHHIVHLPGCTSMTPASDQHTALPIALASP